MKKTVQLLAVLFALQTIAFHGCSAIPDNPRGDTQKTEEGLGTTKATGEQLSDIPELIETIEICTSSALEKNKKNPYYSELLKKVSQPETSLTWLFTGDSITANDNNYSNGFRNYSEIFESYLVNDLGRKNDSVVNTAVSGRRISDISYAADIASFSPDVVYVKIGTNDAFYTDSEVNFFKNSLKKLFSEIKASGAIPIVAVANPFHPDWGNKAQIEAFAIRYTAAVWEVADEMGLLLVDYFTPYTEKSPEAFALWQNGDMLHPSRLGYLKLAQVLINDLGIAVAGSAVLTTLSDVPLAGETVKNPASVSVSDYCMENGSSDFRKLNQKIKESFAVIGGSTAVGETASCITRRTLPQLLGNNNLRGVQQSRFGTTAELCEVINGFSSDTVLLIMPEAYDASGNVLTENISDEISALLDRAEANGNSLLILTPPSNPVNKKAEEENRKIADCLKKEASERKLPVIDLYSYTLQNGEESWYDENGILNYNGCSAVFRLIYRCIH